MRYFSSESVTEGHPDKVSDIIADSILDAILTKDPKARVAVEVSVTTNFCFIYGEVKSRADVNYIEVAKEAIRRIGYTDKALGYNADDVEFLVKIDKQSQDIALGVDGNGSELQGAGDQGIVFGYACNETKEYMPLAITLANKLAKRLSEVRKNKILPDLGPDGKTQVTVEYDKKGKITRVDTIVLSTQHREHYLIDDVREDVKREVIDYVIPKHLVDKNTKYHINPTGRFVTGGPEGDAGLTGRKLIVDTYGGYARHGGGAMSGKDSSKVDRSGAYIARYLAKNIVASKIASRCEIQLGFAIGIAYPVSLYVDTFGTGLVDDDIITKAIWDNFDLSPRGFIDQLKLEGPVYKETAAYGHFGRDFSWEKLDSVEVFKNLLK
ncbi:MAG TPA: methionine adenosyltransferase [Acholeplasmataceae bacterium]|mgnify:CR=1 FL=1|jgi:S-adenosylmethionine synthetase|nr:methionine adenosyltransferase [Acholeplasmataceae bacterium]HQC30207.1 methionine adenosyltransferase [Acholeplasmataceae bacterium]